MPITRTAFIDDDGTGKTGSVWDNAAKQQLYDQIDAMAAGAAPVYGTFTLTDGSGAGIAFTQASGFYTKLGRLVYVTAQVIYPATSNGAAARWAGLPFAVAAGHNGSLYQGYGATAIRTWANGGATILDLFAAANGGPMTNVLMSGANVTVHGVYMTT